MADPLSVAASIVGVIDLGTRTAQVLEVALRGYHKAENNHRQLMENIEMLSHLLREAAAIFVDSDNPLPESATTALSICQVRGNALREAVEKKSSTSTHSIPKRIWMSYKYDIKDMKIAFDAYKESVETLRDIAVMSMMQGIVQRQARLEIETLTLRETTEKTMDHLQRLYYSSKNVESDEKGSESERKALTRTQQSMDGTVPVTSTVPHADATKSTTQYHIDDPADQTYHEATINERKFRLETQRLAAFHPDDTIFNAYLVPTKVNHQERAIVYARCKLDTGSDINLIDSDLIYNHNFQHLISEIPEADQVAFKGFCGALWTPTHHISVEFYLSGVMKKRTGLFFLCPDVDFDLLVCKNYFREISEASFEMQRNVCMLTSLKSKKHLTPEQIAEQALRKAEQRARNIARKNIEDRENEAERTRINSQPVTPATGIGGPVSNHLQPPGDSSGGRALPLTDGSGIMPPSRAGTSRGSLASVESRDPAGANGAAPAVPDVPGAPGDLGGGSATGAEVNGR